MSTNHLLTLLLVFAMSMGCSVMDRQPSSTVTETPPYLQPRSEQSHHQLAEMRVFHEKDTARMAEELRAAHSREMGSLVTTGKELERDQRQQDTSDRTQAQHEKRTGWTSWFKKTESDNKTESNNKKETPPMMSSRIGGANTPVR